MFVANHDTERNGASLTYKSGSIYTLAHVFMLYVLTGLITGAHILTFWSAPTLTERLLSYPPTLFLIMMQEAHPAVLDLARALLVQMAGNASIDGPRSPGWSSGVMVSPVPLITGSVALTSRSHLVEVCTGVLCQTIKQFDIFCQFLGTSGFVAINNADAAWTNTFTTPLAANSYCDMVSGAASSSGSCTGAS